MKKIAIFASGSGSNAEKIMDYIKDSNEAEVACVYSNKPTAGVLGRADKYDIPTFTFTKEDFYSNATVIEDLISRDIDLIALAGFLWLIPETLIDVFPDRIINIHPSLLPKYGGKGMYGINVHKAVSESGDTESGITIHLVNKEYDKGRVISQIRCIIEPHSDPKDIAAKVLKVEHEYFPEVIEQYLGRIDA